MDIKITLLGLLCECLYITSAISASTNPTNTVRMSLTKTREQASLLGNDMTSHSVHGGSRFRRAVFDAEENGFNLRGVPGSGYHVTVAVGTPPQMLNVLVDTGSSNFAIADTALPELNGTYYHPNMSSTYEYIGTDIYVPYTQGEWTGTLMTDVVSFPAIPQAGNFTANIAGIEMSQNFFMNNSLWQGILGLGYPELARPDEEVTPPLDSWFEGTQYPHVFSMQLCGGYVPARELGSAVETGGVMVLGGLDSSLYEGEIVYTPVYKQWYYEVVLTDVKVNDKSLDVPCKEYNFDKTIVDSGTTNLRLPPKIYDKFVREVQLATVMHEDGYLIQPPAGFWAGEEVLCWSEAPWAMFPRVTLTLRASSGRVFDLGVSARQYLMLVETDDGGEEMQELCYKFAVSSSDSGTVIGAVMMEGFYVVFDRQENRVGFAQTTCPNIQDYKATVSSTYKVKMNTTACAYIKAESDTHTLAIALYVMLAVIMLCMLPLVVLFLHWQYHKHCSSSGGGGTKCFSGYGQTDQDNLLEPPAAPATPGPPGKPAPTVR